jgi:hypothetical protein
MRYTQLLSTFFLSFMMLFVHSSTNSMGAGMDMQSIQQELEEANRAIEEYVASLPPEEQAEFNKAVDEISQMFDNMSEEEFEKFLGEMFIEEPMPEPYFESPSPTTQIEPTIATPTLTNEQKKKVENVIKVIDDIIRQSNVFLVQVNSSLETSNNIDEWGKAGKITNWQPGAEWENLKTDIEKFVQKLYKIQDKDLTTSDYKYLSDLIEDEASINNLIQLQTNLNSFIPRIEISEFDIHALSAQSKTALKNALQEYTENLYVVAIPKALDDIFEKHEPAALKAKEAEEAAEKKALDTLKRPRTPAAATSAGASEESRSSGYDYGYGYGSNYGYDGGYGGYSPYDSSYYGGDYGYDGGYGSELGKQSGGFGGGQGGSGGSGGGGSIGGGTSTPTGPSMQKTVPVGPPKEKNPRIKKLVNDISTAMDDINKIITDNKNLKEIDTHVITKAEGIEAEVVSITDITNNIATINKEVITITLNIERLNRPMKDANKNTQAYYNQSLNASIEQPLATISSFNDAITTINYTKNKAKISPLKQWAYFAEDKAEAQIKEDDETEQLAALKKNIKERVSLITLQENIKKMMTAFDELKKNTAQTAEVKIVTTPVKQETTTESEQAETEE